MTLKQKGDRRASDMGLAVGRIVVKTMRARSGSFVGSDSKDTIRFSMDHLATNTIAALKGGKPVDIKLKQLTELKAEIKHRHCPENAVAPLFEVLRLSISTPHLTDAGFSILGHLMKRLELQDQHSYLQAQGVKTYPCLLERLGDPKDRIRQRAAQAFSDFHAVDAQDVEAFMRDNVLTSRSSRAKEAGIQWVAVVRS